MGRVDVYLGTRVKDIAKKGLDTLKETDEIAKAIIDDFKHGRISYRTAMSRMNFLSLIVSRDKKMEGKKRKAKEIINKRRKQLERLHEKESEHKHKREHKSKHKTKKTKTHKKRRKR